MKTSETVDLVHHIGANLRRLAPDARHVLVAVSGGADSVTALVALKASGLRVSAGHYDHRLRADSAEDAAFVARLCEGLGVPLWQGAADVRAIAAARGWNLEDGARRLRYEFLHRSAREAGADVIATGHTLDDQAETLLMQLLRGAFLAKGMGERRGRVVRPMLGVSHAAALAYIEAGGWDHWEDPSNHDRGRTRAWLRHELLPQLEARFPGAATRLAHAAEAAWDADVALRDHARLRFAEPPLSTAALMRAPRALRRAALASLLEGADAAVSRARLEAIEDGLAGLRPRMQLSPKQSLRVAYGRVDVVPAGTPETPERAVRDASELPPGVSGDVLQGGAELLLRSRRPGDVIQLPGGRKLVSDLLIDLKLGREERDELKLLARGSEVYWIDGIAVAQGHGALPAANDRAMMARALRQAERATALGELPVGALVARAGVVLAEAHNRTESDHDAGAHAELLAIREAGRQEEDWRLPGATLYVTLEPCPMCFGAILQTRIERIVYGADNPREGALGGVLDLRAGAWKRRPEVQGGVLASESAALLQRFFEARRGGTADEPAGVASLGDAPTG